MSAMVKTRSGLYVPADLREPRRVRARYDAAATTPENSRHWSNADGYSANAANNPGVRARLRERSRYEAANNTYLCGIIRTLANDTVGTGPRLQIHTGDQKLDDELEDRFGEWMLAVGLPMKLHTMRQARARDGEVFGMLINNPAVARRTGGEIELDLQLLETEMVSAGMSMGFDELRLETDGITLDRHGNPVEYIVLPEHPGGLGWTLGLVRPQRVPAASMLHYFVAERPGQARGIPESTPALPLCAQLRRWTLATLSASENVARIAGVIRTNTNYDLNGAADEEGEIEAPLIGDIEELPESAFKYLPEGWDMSQLKAEQPTATYAEFKHELLNEIARCFNMPFNIAAGNSSNYNYASGRLDHQTYYKAVEVERRVLEWLVLDRLLDAWLWEWQLATGRMLGGKRKHEWFWDGALHVDPQKEAGAALLRLSTGTSSLPREYARQGLDWRREQPAAAEALGLSVDEYRQYLRARLFEQPISININGEDEDAKTTERNRDRRAGRGRD